MDPELKEDGTRVQQALEDWMRQEDGTRVRQVLKEDGPECQQEEDEESSEEDGPECQQEEEEEDFEEPSKEKASQKEEGAGAQKGKKAKKASGSDPTIQVLLKLVEGMQEMHKRIDDSKSGYAREAEVVRHSPEIPKLQEWCSETAPIDFNDWLPCLGPPM